MYSSDTKFQVLESFQTFSLNEHFSTILSPNLN